MRRVLTLVLSISAIAVLSAAAVAQKKGAAKPFYTSGYYNGIGMSSKESGDYFGISVYVTQSANDTFALVTEAQGSIGTPVLIKAKMTGSDSRTIEFTVPDENEKRDLKGTISATGLTMNYFDKKRVLKRQCANTYSSVSTGGGGDVGGMEVYITDAGGSWYALVSMAEGEMGEPVLVPAEVTGKNYEKVAFSVGERKFTGTIGKTSMTVNESGSKSVLKAKCYN